MQYDPVNGGVAGAIELWKMASGSAVRRAYPKYTISLEEHEDGRPAKIEIAYANKQKQVGNRDQPASMGCRVVGGARAS